MSVKDSTKLIDEPARPPEATTRPDLPTLLQRSLRDTTAVLGAVERWDAPTPCTGWTVHEVANHLAGSIRFLTSIVEGAPLDPTELDPQQQPGRLGQQPATEFGAIAARAVAAFTDPQTLARRFDLPAPDLPGAVLANIGLLESLVHGWDIATGAGLDYRPDDDAVAAVREFAGAAIGDEQRRNGLFGPALPTHAHAEDLTRLLAHLGRK
jgi:uncharacterized protein (TIGR03086 family)